jgi:trehalose 6-phosphate phosphatase
MVATHLNKITELVDVHTRAAFLIDFDGTMVDLAPHPDKVDVSEELLQDLRAIEATDFPFAIVSGRPLSKLDKFLPELSLPSIGSSGAEMRRKRRAPIEHLAPPLSLPIRKALHEVGKRHGCFFEDKEYSLSVHLPFSHINDDLASEFADCLGENRLDYIIRKVGRTYEILQSGITKGSAIEHLMQLSHFKGLTPIYIGDDVYMDESLKAVHGLGGLLVPVRFMHHQNKAERADANAFTSDDVRLLISLLAKQITVTNAAQASRVC